MVTLYHQFLRTAAIVAALMLVFDSGILLSSTSHIANNTQLYLANAIGMSASVEPTELNQLTAELTAQKKALEAREAALKERELTIGLANSTRNQDYSTYILASILFILLVLILLNYTLDYVRSREQNEPAVVH